MRENQMNVGTCYICHQTVEAENASQHLTRCLPNVSAAYAAEGFLLKVATGEKRWLYVSANGNVPLKNLYLFLRENWFECCGFLGELILDDKVCSPEDMEKPLSQMLKLKQSFHYYHDAGFPTKITGEVLEIVSTQFAKDLQLVLRREVVEEPCESCASSE